ncbi:MAG: DUF6506 family protein [Actinomycetota bacterium]|nr:DUF6506 family protein [Actinomycetota bacterium]
MAHFHELLLALSPAATPGDRLVRANALSHTTIAWVPDVAAAIEVVKSIDRLDLIELYCGFGPGAAAAVLDATGNGELPVGMVGVEYPAPPKKTVAIFEAPGADPAVDRWTTGGTTMVGVPSADAAAAVAAELVSEGAERVEVCGGMSGADAAVVRAAVHVPVSRILFGFESLPAVAAYRARFERTLEEHPDVLDSETEILR